jgi:peptidoglycan/xylan/chitin deacetylase (PgdA/CDA1 family)
MIVRSLVCLLSFALAALPATAATPSVAAAPVAPGATSVAGVPVLMYHQVDPATPADAVGRSLTLAPAAFAAQLAWLRDHHIATLTMDQLADALRRGEHPRRSVVLTFDDGYIDAATVVTPLLERYGAHASFYVSAGFLGDGRHMTWPQLRAMHAAGMEIGCHGTHHLDLATLDRSAATHEIGHCVDTLARYLARPTTYAYAAGKWNATTLAIIKAAGLKAALTERPGTVTSLASPYTLPRRRVDRSAGIDAFAALATP